MIWFCCMLKLTTKPLILMTEVTVITFQYHAKKLDYVLPSYCH